jgi:chorismate-pyruvate lyase
MLTLMIFRHDDLVLPIREEELSPLHRILLHTDGTVTEVLRQWTGSIINIVKPPLNTCFLWDKLDKHSLYYKGNPNSETNFCKDFKYREVILQSAQSNQNLVYALSLICLKNITPSILLKLDHTDMAIGMIINSEKLETYREILTFNKFKVSDFPFFQKKIFPRANHFILHRAYTISHDQKPVFIINEYFPSEPEHFDYQVAASDKERILNYPRESLKE